MVGPLGQIGSTGEVLVGVDFVTGRPLHLGASVVVAVLPCVPGAAAEVETETAVVLRLWVLVHLLVAQCLSHLNLPSSGRLNGTS